MATQIETKLQYVKRMLNDPAYNNSQLCRVTGLTPATVCKIANGDTKNPTYDTVEKIADYFAGLK